MGNGVTAWLAVLALLAHAVIMAAHVPPPLARLLGQAAPAAAKDATPCHAIGRHAGQHPDHDAPPAGPSGHLTYCPICLTAQDGKLLKPADGPVVAMPTAVAVTAPRGPADPITSGRPTLPFSARAPPAVV